MPAILTWWRPWSSARMQIIPTQVGNFESSSDAKTKRKEMIDVRIQHCTTFQHHEVNLQYVIFIHRLDEYFHEIHACKCFPIDA